MKTAIIDVENSVLLAANSESLLANILSTIMDRQGIVRRKPVYVSECVTPGDSLSTRFTFLQLEDEETLPEGFEVTTTMRESV